MANLFTDDLAELTHDVLRDFLSRRIPEDVNLEYKAALSPQIQRTVAAMANGYGGLILIGVTEQNGLPAETPGVELGTRDALVNQLFAKLEPPIEPEIVAVPVELDQRFVLIVRVPPAFGARPIVIDGTVYVRLRGQTQPADRYRIAALFTEQSSPRAGLTLPNVARSARGGHPPVDGQENALVLRASASARVPAGRSTVLNSDVRRLFADALTSSPLTHWMREETGSSQPWVRRGFITQSVESLQWGREEIEHSAATIAGQGVLELNSSRTADGYASVVLDLVLRPVPDGAGMPPYRFPIDGLHHVIHVQLSTLLDHVGTRVFGQMTGLTQWALVGPGISLDTQSEPLSRYVLFESWPRAGDVQDRPGPFLEAPQNIDARDPIQRRQLVQEWLAQTLYNEGFTDFERYLEGLARER